MDAEFDFDALSGKLETGRIASSLWKNREYDGRLEEYLTVQLELSRLLQADADQAN